MRSRVIEREMPAQPIGSTGLRSRPGPIDRGRGIVGASRRRAQVVAHRYGERDVAVRRALALADAVAISAALAVALLVASHHPRQFLWGLATLPVWIVVLKAYGLYDRDIKRISHGTVDDLPWIFHAVLVGSALLFGYYRLTPHGGISLTSAAVFAIAAFLAISSLRALARRLTVSLLGPERVLLIGDRRQIATLGRKLEAHPEYGGTPVGIVSADSTSALSSGLPLLGRLEGLDLAAVVREHTVERVVLAYQDFDERTLLDLLHRSRELGVKVNVLPQPF